MGKLTRISTIIRSNRWMVGGEERVKPEQGRPFQRPCYRIFEQ